MNTSKHQQVIEAFTKSGLQGVFRDVLGWDSQENEIEKFPLTTHTASGLKIASLLSGVAVLKFDFKDTAAVSPSLQKEILRAVGMKYVEHLVIFETNDSSTWLWPKKTAGGSLTHEKLDVPTGKLPLFLAQRLAGLAVSANEFMNGLSLNAVREKLRGSFDTSTVTKKFYDRFRVQHQNLAKAISGLTEDESASYATLLLNRLMFIYFLQKKEFLNGDSNYLRTCLNRTKSISGRNGFYNFYKDLLLVLFFEGLNSPDREFKTPAIAEIIGDVPYVNGGIFGESALEHDRNIEIEDRVFEDIFDFFDSFTWHLDTRPTGNSNEINPEVIGYIFEQYINFTSGGKKENGAYYTKQDVTGYMVGSTVVPRILDILTSIDVNPIIELPTSGDRYIHESLLHGWSASEKSWLEVPENLYKTWLDDPITWGLLDEAEIDPAVCLPGETWVETFARRERVENLRRQISSGEVSEVNDLITLNLNCQLILLDAIDRIDDFADFEDFWKRLNALSVIDPTCGSGAFLFAALEVLEDVYSHALDRAEDFSNGHEVARALVQSVNEHPSRRYYIRKSVALNNLFGTDLMPDAIETAKLRIFLALASCLEKAGDIEPLPDLDFNLKTGNLVVGFKDADDADRVGGNQIIAAEQIKALAPSVDEYIKLYADFVESSVSTPEQSNLIKRSLLQTGNLLRKEANKIYAECIGVEASEIATWAENVRPFHWFAEFPQIIARGGFDVVVGNPPYVKSSELDKDSMPGFKTVNCPDLYAICYERSLSLLAPTGRHAFITMLSLSFSPRFGEVRKLFSEQGYSEWWSSFGIYPDSLFTGVRVRNTIVILGPSGKVFSSNHNIFSKATRASLFSTLDYKELVRAGVAMPIRSGEALGLALQVRQARNVPRPPSTVNWLYVRPTGQYWFPVLPSAVPILNAAGEVLEELDGSLKSANFFDHEEPEIVVPTLAGKLGYLIWSSTGDDFHSKISDVEDIRNFLGSFAQSSLLKELGAKVIQGAGDVTYSTLNAGKRQINIRWSSIRNLTDKFDRQLLVEAGAIQHWRSLNIWYRKVMRSSGDNLGSTYLTREQRREYGLSW